jgi:ubiquinone/menaquinone biosynthesis C-methylase UbiE
VTSSAKADRNVAEDWYADSFGALYPLLYAHRTVEAARPEACFAMGKLRLTSDDAALDLCCGNGRHMVALAEGTPHLTGLDYSPTLLNLARKRLRPHARLLRGDMRHLPFPTQFDVVFNFFTSFGYFQSDTENQGVLAEIARVLKPGGRFFMDFLNAPQVADTLVPHSERTAEDLHIVEERWIAPEGPRVNKKTLVRQDGKLLAELGESVRLYTLEELTDSLRAAGLVIDATYGNYAGAPWDKEQPRCILTGHREACHAVLV